MMWRLPCCAITICSRWRSASLSAAVAADLSFHDRLIRHLAERGLLDRTLEALPVGDRSCERTRRDSGLTRPELAVLLAYSKIALYHDLLASEVPDDPFMEELLRYFPAMLARLLRAISASIACGARSSPPRSPTASSTAAARRRRCGWRKRAVRPISEVAHAFMATRAVFSLADAWRRIDGLDGKVSGAIQLDLYGRIQQILNRNVAWFLRHDISTGSLTDAIGKHKTGFESLKSEICRSGYCGCHSPPRDPGGGIRRQFHSR